jgi:signal transduction histidine kinase
MKKESLHILLVEDEEPFAKLVKSMFQMHAPGFHVDVVENLKDAWDYLSKNKPEFIISDLMLPDGQGIELLSINKKELCIPIMIMTGHGDEKIAVEAMKAGALDYIVKSHDTVMMLHRIVQRALREWQLQLDCRDAELELKKAKKELEKRVEERTSDLMKTNQQLLQEIEERKRMEKEKDSIQSQLIQAQKMEAIGVLAGGLAHDFNNLLTVIRGSLELAMLDIEETHSSISDLKEALKSIDLAFGLTRQVLLFSRKHPMELNPINLNQLVQNLHEMLKRLIGEDIRIVMKLESNLKTVHADKGTIEQVILNLVVNARDAIKERGGVIKLETKNVQLDKETTDKMIHGRPGQYVQLSITDNGSGMDKKTQQRIFEPFFSTKEAGKGTGLGLSSVLGIIQQHEGWIQVDSNPGVGTTFNIYLPIIQMEPVEEENDKALIEKIRGKGECILLVEEDENIRKYVTVALKRYGYKVFPAVTAEEGLELFHKKKEKIQLVFSDVVLPGKTGIELVDEIKNKYPAIRVLLSSGYLNDKSHWPLVKKRGYPFLRKPYSLTKLLITVYNVLSE